MTDRATRIADKVVASLKGFKREDPLMFHAVIVEAVHKVDAELEGEAWDTARYKKDFDKAPRYTASLASVVAQSQEPAVTGGGLSNAELEDTFATDVLEPLVDRAVEAIEEVAQDIDAFDTGAIFVSDEGEAEHVPAQELNTIEISICQATQQEDEMFCAFCGLRWAVEKDKPKAAKCI